MELSKEDENFLECCKKNLIDNGYSYQESFDEKEPCSYFSSDEKILRVIKGKNWFPTFVHEYCHFEQELEGQDCNFDGLNCSEIMDHWFEGREYPKETISQVFHLVAMDELDCEKRVVKKIIENNLSIDIDDYIRMANTYISSYYIMEKKRKWLPIAPYHLRYWFPATFDIDHKVWAWALEDRYRSIFV